MIKFAVETWDAMLPEAEAIFPIHWQELAVDKDKIKLAIDNDRYRAMEAGGILHVLTVRSDRRLVGYYVAFLLPHVHYKEAGLMAFTDFYFILPKFREGGSGAKLFVEAEKTLRARGVTKAYLSCKVHQDHTELFERLGWKKTDFSFTKYFGA